MTTPIIFPEQSETVMPEYDWDRSGGYQRHPPQLRILPLPTTEDVTALIAEVNAEVAMTEAAQDVAWARIMGRLAGWALGAIAISLWLGAALFVIRVWWESGHP